MSKIIEKLKQLDLPLIFCYLMLIFIGLFIQLDISSMGATIKVFLKQFLITLSAIGFVLFIYLFLKIKLINKFFYVFYFVVLYLLINVLSKGIDSHGAIRSLTVNLRFFQFSLQPSLLARLVLVILFAKVISKRKEYIANSGLLPFLYHFFPLLLFSGVYYYLIILENHLSSVITSALTLISLLYLAKFRKATLLLLLVLVTIIAGSIISFQEGGEFRLKRLESWTKSSLVIRWVKNTEGIDGIHRNNLESLICLSTGKMLGTSPDGGMGKLDYLPEADTDFVYAIIGEEFGLFGLLLVLLFYMGLVFRGLSISARQPDMFCKILGYGFSLNIFFNVVIHIGTVTSCLPTTGVTLPFISMGGSSMIANSLAIGVLLKLARTQEHTYETNTD
jgi:cell division protein FtsW